MNDEFNEKKYYACRDGHTAVDYDFFVNVEKSLDEIKGTLVMSENEQIAMTLDHISELDCAVGDYIEDPLLHSMDIFYSMIKGMKASPCKEELVNLYNLFEKCVSGLDYYRNSLDHIREQIKRS
jgi:hypothetical protein